MSATRTLILALKADASNFTQNMALAKKETTLMEKEMALFAEKNKLGKNSLALMSAELKSSKDAQNILAKQIEMTNNQLKIQIDKYGATSKQAQDYRIKLADLELAQAKLNNTIKAQPTQMVNQAGKNMVGVGNAMSMGVTAPIIGAGAGILAIGDNFETAYNKIRAMTGKTGEEFEKLKKSLENVYVQRGENILDISTAMSILTQRTDLTGKSLENMALIQLRLAKLTNSDLNPQIELTTKMFGDWGIEIDKQPAALDRLLKIYQATGIGASTLADGMREYGAPLRTMGFTFDQSTALMGKFQKEGVNTELVLAGLRTGAVNFAKAGIKDIPTGFNAMINSIKNMASESEATLLSAELFGAKKANDMMRAIKEGRFDLSQIYAEINNNPDTINQAAKDTITFAGAMKKLSHEAEVAVMPIGISFVEALKGLIPLIKTSLQNVTDLIGRFTALPQSTQNTILGVLGVTAAIGPMISGLGLAVIGVSGLMKMGPAIATFSGGFVTAFNAIRTATMAAAAGEATFGAAFMAAMGPAGWVALGTVALGAAALAIWKLNSATEATKMTIVDIVPTIASETMAINNNTAAVDGNIKAKLEQINLDARTAKNQQSTIQKQFDTATYSEMLLKRIGTGTATEQMADIEWLKKNNKKALDKVMDWWGKVDATQLESAIIDQKQIQLDTSSKLNAGYTAQDIANYIADGYTFGGANVNNVPNGNAGGGLTAAQLAAIMGTDKKASSTEEKAINQINNALDSYKSKMDSAIESTMKFVGTFDKFEVKGQSIGSMIRNMGKNLTAMKDYYSNMKLLENRGLSGGLISDLYTRGVSASADVKRLANASDEQLSTINTTYAEQQDLSNQIGYRKISSKESVTQYVANINGKSFNDNELVQKIFELLAGYNIQLAN
jgi:phage-related minor tail protein